MWKTIEKLAALFCVIVFVTFLVNHGKIDFTGVDWLKEKTVETINSNEGQEIINETKSISKDVFRQLYDEIVKLITGKETQKDTTLPSATLVDVIDGDTIKVLLGNTETTIRLIGIDTPESVNPDEDKNNEFGFMASDYTKALLENVNTLYLEYDISTEDTYGRKLAYVWLSANASDCENNMLNAILVKNGYAKDVVYMPNNKYADVFLSLRKTAQEKKNGLWQYKDFEKLWN